MLYKKDFIKLDKQVRYIMDSERVDQIAADAEKADKAAEGLRFTNDFSDADKQAVKDFVNKEVDKTLAQPQLTINDLTHLAQVAHGSIKSRSKSTSSAREIVLGVINGVRAERSPIVNKESAKSFINSLSPEEKEAYLKELLGG